MASRPIDEKIVKLSVDNQSFKQKLTESVASLKGLSDSMSGVKTEDEGLYTVQHRYWHEEMKKALEQEQQLHGANSD